MKKTLVVLLALALLVASFAACGGTGTGSASSASGASVEESSETAEGGSDTLVLYTWEGMFPQEVLDAFESDTGIKINYVNFDTDETMLAKLESTNGGEYDIVIDTKYGRNTVHVSRGAICVSESDCPDHICMNQGAITKSGVPIICMPHRLVIQIEGGGIDA